MPAITVKQLLIKVLEAYNKNEDTYVYLSVEDGRGYSRPRKLTFVDVDRRTGDINLAASREHQ